MINFYRYYAGIAIRSSGITIVVIKKQSQQWQLIDYQDYPINIPLASPNTMNSMTFLRQWRASLPRRSRIAVCLPSQLANQQQISLPLSSPLSAKMLAIYVQQWQIHQATKQPLTVDYQLVKQNEQPRLIITYLNRTIFHQWQQCLQQQTLYLSCMTLSLFALTRVLQSLTLPSSVIIIYQQTDGWLWLYRASSYFYGDHCPIEDSPNYQLLQNHIIAACQQQLLPPPSQTTVYYMAKENAIQQATEYPLSASITNNELAYSPIALSQLIGQQQAYFAPLTEHYLLALGCALMAERH